MTAKAALAGMSTAVLLLLPLVARPLHAQDKTGDQPISLGSGDAPLPGSDEHPLQITGFGVADYTYNARTSENSFNAGKLAVGFFREVTNLSYAYGQLTTAVTDEGGETSTETEIDNLLVSTAVPGATNLSFTLGKLDLPVGFERDDEPLNFLASPSYNFELARPVKLVGLTANWAATPMVDLQGMVFNGWDDAGEENHGKTVGSRIGLRPSERVVLGVSGLYGVEGPQGATSNRFLFNADYSFQPAWNWVFAGEANYGGDRGVMPDGSDAVWAGAMLTAMHQFTAHVGLAARAEVFRDRDGARTGLVQTLTSYTLAPLFSIGVGRDGMFANVEHTTFRIPRLQVRAEARLNHSTLPIFETSTGLSQWGTELRLQAVTTF